MCISLCIFSPSVLAMLGVMLSCLLLDFHTAPAVAFSWQCFASSCKQWARPAAALQKGGVVTIADHRGNCIAFWLSVPSLQAVPSFACSVASLSLFPGPSLPGTHGLSHTCLPGCLLDGGKPFACRAEFVTILVPPPPQVFGDRRVSTPM